MLSFIHVVGVQLSGLRSSKFKFERVIYLTYLNDPGYSNKKCRGNSEDTFMSGS